MLSTWFSIAGAVFASVSLLASMYVVMLALVGFRRQPGRFAALQTADVPTTFLILIPAHNEEAGIESTIRSALALDYPRSQFCVVVVADNCDDKTALVAQHYGAEVWVRQDVQNRGKGQALAWALEHAKDRTFDMLVVIDADTEMDRDYLAVIDREYAMRSHSHEGVVYQGRYEFAAEPGTAGWFEAFTVASKAAENSFVYRPRSQMGLMNLLQGNGFCVNRYALQQVPFAATSVVEDAEYAVALALHGFRVRYMDEARVVSRTTRSIRDAAPQRLRWATGVFQLIGRAVPRLLWQSLVRRNWRLAEGAIMMLLTSRLVVVYLSFAAFFFAALSLRGPFTMVTAVLLLSAFFLQSMYLFLTFRKAGRQPVSMRSILFMPIYFTLICVAQAGALIGFRRKHWGRTIR